MVPATMAANKKPPKVACYKLDGSGPLDDYVLAIVSKKTSMKIKDSTGKVIFYQIMAAMRPENSGYWNMDGSGYYDAYDGEFEGNIDGLVSGDFTSCELFFGDLRAFCARAPNLDAYVVYDFTELNCGLEELD